MPLHAVARFSKALPQGDRGGNEVHIPNPRGRGGRSNNLHVYWDDLVGTDQDPAAIEKMADELILEYPRAGFTDELAEAQHPVTGLRRAFEICLKTVLSWFSLNWKTRRSS